MHGCVENHYFDTMAGTVVLLTLLPALVACAGEGNIRLLEEEVAVALKACSYPNENGNPKETATSDRQRRSDNSYDGSPRIDDNMKQGNRYSHERRNTSDTRDQLQVINATDYDYDGYGSGNMGEKLLTSVPKSASTGNSNSNASTPNTTRTKRSETLFNKPDSDQVDSRGIPREAELWNKVQSSVTSQQSRSALRDQIRACFQELQSEAEDNGCSYANKLERCLMLRFADRKGYSQGATTKPTSSTE